MYRVGGKAKVRSSADIKYIRSCGFEPGVLYDVVYLSREESTYGMDGLYAISKEGRKVRLGDGNGGLSRFGDTHFEPVEIAKPKRNLPEWF